MSVIQTGDGKAPEWCELEDFEIINMKYDERRTFKRKCDREIYVVATGAPVFSFGDYECKGAEGAFVHVPSTCTDDMNIWAWHYNTMIIRMVGHWKSMATAGVHIIKTAEKPLLDGMPYDDNKTTDFDRHYHDCQEYWVIYDGEGRLVIGEKFFDVKPGDCVLTPRAWHQDVESIKGGGDLSLIWLGSTLHGEKRVGHLYESKNGVAEPEIPLPETG